MGPHGIFLLGGLIFYMILSINNVAAFITGSADSQINELEITNGISDFKQNHQDVDVFSDCPDKKVSFWLFTVNNSVDGEEILINNSYFNIESTTFRREWPTKIIVHGFRDHSKKERLVRIKNEYLKKGPHNVIALEWKELASGSFLRYFQVRKNVYPVGKCLARFITKLREQNVENIHGIGYSLGAQVLAATAHYIRPYKMDRITGLDPAGPGFSSLPESEKLDKSDAHFVDVIHTNYGVRGEKNTCGHIDFYMNGGFHQPGCWIVGCSHYRALEYFAESINSEIGFWGWPCESLSSYQNDLCQAPKLMLERAGDTANATHQGLHLVLTNSKSPYAKGPFST